MSNKLVEKYDDNPGAYFSMLVESLLDEDSYSSNGSDNRQVNFSNGSYAGKSEWSSNSKYGSSGKSYSDDWGSKKYQTTDKDKASDSYYKQNQKAQDDMKKNGNAVEEISKLSKDVADYTERKMETIQINGSSVQCKGVGDINNFKKRLLKHGYKEEKASGDWNSIFANDKVSNAKLGITNKGAVVLFYQNPQKESLTEAFEHVDDNPGAYFGMLVEGLENEKNLLKEDSEYKTLAKLSNGLEVISYPYGYAVSDGYVADRFVVRDGKYIFDDGRFRLSDKDKEKILSLIKKGVIEESLKESYSKSDLYSALEYMYGFNKKEANDWIKKASDKMKQSVVDGWKGNAKKSALTDSLKEDKFVSRDKMSKKDRKELDSQKRNTWGNTNPVTRVQPNKKAYDRKRDKKVVDEALTEDSDIFKDMSNALDDIEHLCNDTYNWDTDEWNDKENVKRTAERIIESAQVLLDSIKKY